MSEHHCVPDRREDRIAWVRMAAASRLFCFLQVPSKELSDHILKMSVIDAGKTKRRNVIGYVTFPLRDLPAESEQILYKMDLEKVSDVASTGYRSLFPVDRSVT
jgi:hypothetical protein